MNKLRATSTAAHPSPIMAPGLGQIRIYTFIQVVRTLQNSPLLLCFHQLFRAVFTQASIHQNTAILTLLLLLLQLRVRDHAVASNKNAFSCEHLLYVYLWSDAPSPADQRLVGTSTMYSRRKPYPSGVKLTESHDRFEPTVYTFVSSCHTTHFPTPRDVPNVQRCFCAGLTIACSGFHHRVQVILQKLTICFDELLDVLQQQYTTWRVAYSWDECRLNQFILLKCLLCWSFDECASKFAKQTDISADKVDQEVRREHKGSKIISFSIDLRGTVSSPRTSILRSTSLQYYFREFRLQGHNGVASKAHTRTQPFGHFLSPTTTLDYCKQYS